VAFGDFTFCFWHYLAGNGIDSHAGLVMSVDALTA